MNRALMLLPLHSLGSIVGQVMFPTLARIRDQPEQFRSLYTRSIRQIAFVAFPIIGEICVLAEPTIFTFNGKEWKESILIIRIMSIAGLFQYIIVPVGWIFNSLSWNKMQFWLTVLLVPPFLLFMGMDLQYGLLGVTWGYAAWAALSGVPHIYVAGRLIEVTVRVYLTMVAHKALGTAVMMLAAAMAEPRARAHIGIFRGTVLVVLLGARVYRGVLRVMRDPDLATFVARAWPIVRKLRRA